jgi:microcystin-dependent protein
MADPFIGEIKLIGFNFAPHGWAFCSGQILPINQNQALFALLGTTYGGNGQTTFALPDLRGRVALHTGQGPGLSSYNLGQQAGSEGVTLTVNEIPAHTHVAAAGTGVGDQNDPSNNIAVAPMAVGNVFGASHETTSSTLVGTTGSGQPHNNVMPSIGLNYIIALLGIFPSRN